jgi:mono/diheme cytochrome c family protein
MPFALSRHPWAIFGTTALVVASAMTIGMSWNIRHQSEAVARAMVGGDLTRAPAIIRRYGCAGCHTIPGIPGGDGQVGAPLADIKRRVYVGGVVPNSPDTLVRWIVSPQTFSPRSAMPATGISEAEARDVATYLYSR